MIWWGPRRRPSLRPAGRTKEQIATPCRMPGRRRALRTIALRPTPDRARLGRGEATSAAAPRAGRDAGEMAIPRPVRAAVGLLRRAVPRTAVRVHADLRRYAWRTSFKISLPRVSHRPRSNARSLPPHIRAPVSDERILIEIRTAWHHRQNRPLANPGRDHPPVHGRRASLHGG